MSLKYGLNVKKAAPAPVRKTLLDDEEEDDDEVQNGGDVAEDITSFGGKRASKPTPSSKGAPLNGSTRPPPVRRKGLDDRQDLSSQQAAQAKVKAAEELDASIFDYDSFHDAKTSVTDAKKAAARQDAIDRKPKYINNLLDAAARRKQDQQVAREKFLQKEREAEGDEFADKEKFVTGAYKEQQAETRRLEEEEKVKAEEEERRKRGLGGGMQGFYRGMIDQMEEQHREALEAAEKMERGTGDTGDGEVKAEKSDAQLAAELRAKGVSVHINDEGQITDKRELLSAGLNISTSNKSSDSRGGADHLKSSAQRSAQSAFAASKNANRDAQRERQSKMMEEQLAARAKRAREEEEEERQKAETAAKSTKTATDVSDAKARYLARKAAKAKEGGG